MVKPAITTLLALLCLLLIKANIDTFRITPASQQDIVEATKKDRSKRIKIQEPLKLNPAIKPSLPDLNSDYLFNAERFLAKESQPGKAGKGYGNNIRMDDVVFSGAILGEGYQKAIVSYLIKAKTAAQIKRAGPKAKAPSRRKTTLLEVGEELGGYTVTEIATDFILFMKGSDTIKKMLFDPDKNRRQVAPRKKTPAATKKLKPSVSPARRPTTRTVKKP
ncbi:MAG: hypothetical protein ABFS09_06835 [Thermodesulfobacteriota bacterium]